MPKIIFEGIFFYIIITIVFYTTKNLNDTDQIFLSLGIFVALMVRLLQSINKFCLISIILNFVMNQLKRYLMI